MFQSHRTALGMATLMLLGILAGCSSRVSQEQQKGAAPAQKAVQETPVKPTDHDHASHEGHGHTKAGPTGVAAGLAELSAEDRAAAEKQRVCPVSGDVLGEQGKPYKVSVKGQVVFLCCPACEKELQAHPDKYLAKLQSGKPK